MIKLISVIGMVIAVVCSFGLYQLKHQTDIAEREVANLKTQLSKEQEYVHILHAEWNYINRPENIKQKVEAHLPGMDEMKPEQLVDISEIPYRPLSLEDLIGDIEREPLRDDGAALDGPATDEIPDVTLNGKSLTRGGKVNG